MEIRERKLSDGDGRWRLDGGRGFGERVGEVGEGVVRLWREGIECWRSGIGGAEWGFGVGCSGRVLGQLC